MAKSDLRYIVVADAAPGQRIGLVRRGVPGHQITDYDDGSLHLSIENEDGWSIESWVRELNARLDGRRASLTLVVG